MRVFSWFSAYFGQLMGEVLLRTLRGSLLVAGGMFMITSTGVWQYLASSLAAHDLQRSARWTVTDSTDVVVVAIDDQAFEEHFGGRSPLDRQRLHALLRAVDDSAPPTAVLVVDLDLSPVPDQPGDALTALWRETRPLRWVIADPVLTVPDASAQRSAWREAVCGAGVGLGLPYVPFEFGYASSSHQYRGSLAHVASLGEAGCGVWRREVLGGPVQDGMLQLTKLVAPLHGSTLSEGVVIPFQGDVDALKATLAQLAPKAVVIGGTWGRSDLFSTPFGERYGVQLHAAALKGHLERLRMAPYGVQVLCGWLLVAILSLCMASLRRWVVRVCSPWNDSAPGHKFFMRRIWPLLITALMLAALLGISELLAIVHGRTGYWIPTTSVAFVVFASMVFVWNWGINEMPLHGSVSRAWHNVFVVPLKDDILGFRTAARRLVQKDASHPIAMSRPRAALESALCGLSLGAQTVFPVIALYFAVTRPL